MYQNTITIWLIITIIFTLKCFTTLASDPDPVQDYCIPNPKFGSESKTVPHLHVLLPCKSPAEATADDFVFSGLKSAGNFSRTGLASIPVGPTAFPGLNTLGMSFVRADLKPGAINPPHFHPRATEIAYVVRGSVYSGFVDSGNRVFARIVEEGEVMVYPRGLVHFQMNVGKKHATVFGSFNGQSPGLLKIPDAVFGSGIHEELLEKAFGLSSKQIGKMRRKFDSQSSED